MTVKQVSNLVEVLETSVASFGPRRLFGVRREGRYDWITYKEFGALVDKVRAGLAGLGVGRDDRVAIICDNSIEWAASAYATYGLGAHFVPMYEKQLASDWAYILEDATARVVIVANEKIHQQVRPLIDTIGSLEHVVCIRGGGQEGWEALLARGLDKPVPSYHPEPNAVAGLIYTSGTTGMPKGVILTHGNFAHNINGVREIFDIRDDDCSLSFLPWAHSFGQTCELHCMLANGGAMGLAESVTTIMLNLAEVRPTLLFAVPRIFNKIYSGLRQKVAIEGGFKEKLFHAAVANAQKRRELAARGQSSFLADQQHKVFDSMVFSKIRERFGGRLRYAFSGGAALSSEVAIFLDLLGITIYEGYGLSETSPIATANAPGHRKIGSVGRPLPGVTIEIDPVEHIQERGVGEVIIYGPNVMQGYHNLPEETAQVFTEDGGFRSGDLGRLDDDGYLHITGRVKEQYKLENGKYVVPAPLEELLKLSPYINQVMIHGDNRPYNVALVVPDFEGMAGWLKERGKASDPEALVKDPDVKKLIHEHLTDYGQSFKGYEHPRKFRLLTEEFTTDNDMLTPKMSLKRRNVLKTHGALIEEMYAE